MKQQKMLQRHKDFIHKCEKRLGYKKSIFTDKSYGGKTAVKTKLCQK